MPARWSGRREYSPLRSALWEPRGATRFAEDDRALGT